VQPQ
jgi:hypothetical protein